MPMIKKRVSVDFQKIYKIKYYQMQRMCPSTNLPKLESNLNMMIYYHIAPL